MTEASFEAEVTLDSAIMLLIGSTAALQGRHNYRMPLCSLAKALVASEATITLSARALP